MHFGRILVQLHAALAVNELQPSLAMHFHLSVEREVLGFPRFQVSRGQYGDCKDPTGKQQLMPSKVCNLACLRSI